MNTMNKALLSIPPVRTPRLASLKAPGMHSFSNGVPVYLFPSDKTEIIRLELGYRAGAVFESKPLQAQFTSLLLTSGTSSHTARQIDEAFDFYGSFPAFTADRDKASAHLYMLPKHFRETATLLKEVVSDPLFPESELNMHRDNRLQRYLINRQRVSFITLDHFFEALFGSDHPYGRKVVPAHFNELNTDDLRRFHEAYYKNGLSRIVLSGNITDEIMRITEELFGHETVSDIKGTIPPLETKNGKAKKTFVEMTDAVQNSIRIGKRTIAMGHPDYQGLKVVDTILGGYFGSRLMRNLREEKGYTYGIGSSVSSLKLSGIIIITTEVGSSYTADAVREIYREIDLLRRKHVSKSELKLARRNLLGELVRQFDGPFATTESSMPAIEAGLGIDYFKTLENTVKSITQDKIKQLAETYYNPESFHEIIAGSKG
jgi:zinc protease